MGLPAATSRAAAPPEEAGRRKCELPSPAAARQPSPPQPPVSPAASPTVTLNSGWPLCSRRGTTPTAQRALPRPAAGSGSRAGSGGCLSASQPRGPGAAEPQARPEVAPGREPAPTPEARAVTPGGRAAAGVGRAQGPGHRPRGGEPTRSRGCSGTVPQARPAAPTPAQPGPPALTWAASSLPWGTAQMGSPAPRSPAAGARCAAAAAAGCAAAASRPCERAQPARAPALPTLGAPRRATQRPCPRGARSRPANILPQSRPPSASEIPRIGLEVCGGSGGRRATPAGGPTPASGRHTCPLSTECGGGGRVPRLRCWPRSESCDPACRHSPQLAMLTARRKPPPNPDPPANVMGARGGPRQEALEVSAARSRRARLPGSSEGWCQVTSEFA